jgi:hypothetical protein
MIKTWAYTEMKYLPYENLTFRTKLDAEEILLRIKKNTEPEKMFRMNGLLENNDHKPYEGNVDGMTFHLTRIISYRNSFLPKISGLIERDFHGTKVTVKMKLSSSTMAFMMLWCGGVALDFFIILIFSMKEKSFKPGILIPLGALLFAYLLTIGGFKSESSKSKEFLSQLLEAEIEAVNVIRFF